MAITTDKHADDSAEPIAPLARHLLWVDTASGVQRLVTGLIVLCVFLFLMDFLWHRHVKVPGEEWYGFYAIVGFASFTVIVVGAKNLRRLIARDESFYAPDGVDAEDYPMAGTNRLQHGEQGEDTVSTLVGDMLGREDQR